VTNGPCGCLAARPEPIFPTAVGLHAFSGSPRYPPAVRFFATKEPRKAVTHESECEMTFSVVNSLVRVQVWMEAVAAQLA